MPKRIMSLTGVAAVTIAVTFWVAPAGAKSGSVDPAGAWIGHGVAVGCVFTLTDQVGITAGVWTVNSCGIPAPDSGSWTVTKGVITLTAGSAGCAPIALTGKLTTRGINTGKRPIGIVFVPNPCGGGNDFTWSATR